MASLRWIPTLTCFLALGVGACGDDPTGGSSGGGGTDSGTDTDTGSGSTGGVSTSTAGGASGTGSTGGVPTSTAGTGGGSTTGAITVTLSGELSDRIFDLPIPDAAVSVHGMPGFETVTDANGLYTIEGLAPDSELFIIVDPSADFFGSVVPVGTEAPGGQDQDLAQVSRMFVDTSKGIVESMGSETLDMVTKGVIFARVIQNTAVGEGPVTVDMTPAPVVNTYFGLDPNGNPILNTNTTEYGLLPVVLFANLDPADAGTYSISAAHDVRTCTPVYATFPVLAEHLTLADVNCPPS